MLEGDWRETGGSTRIVGDWAKLAGEPCILFPFDTYGRPFTQRDSTVPPKHVVRDTSVCSVFAIILSSSAGYHGDSYHDI